jgi:hypothetical protein
MFLLLKETAVIMLRYTITGCFYSSLYLGTYHDRWRHISSWDHTTNHQWLPHQTCMERKTRASSEDVLFISIWNGAHFDHPTKTKNVCHLTFPFGRVGTHRYQTLRDVWLGHQIANVISKERSGQANSAFSLVQWHRM